MEERPTAVSEVTKQAGDIQGEWTWVEPSVWTERMLTALEEGVKGTKWFSLMEKVRMRLRSILRKRRGLRGRGRGADHQRWPNAFFVEQGLFSLATARAQYRQSLQR